MTMLNLLKPQSAAPVESVIWDRSALESYSTCPAMPYLMAKHKVAGDSAIQQVGIEGHRIIAETWQSFANQDDLSGMRDYLVDEGRMSRPDIQPDVLRVLKNIANKLTVIGGQRIIGVEKQLSAPAGVKDKEGRPVVFSMAYDLLTACRKESELAYTDYKLGYKVRSNTEAAEAFQTQFGGLLIWQNYPQIQTIHVFYEQPRAGKTAYARLDRERDFHDFQGRAWSSLDRAVADDHPAWPDPVKCSWCTVAHLCEKADTQAADLKKDPADYLERMIIAEAIVKKMKAALTGHWKSGHKITTRDGKYEFGHFPSERISCKVKKAEALSEDDDGD